MKLYELKMPVKVYCECSDNSKFIIVDHLDGAYSFCKTENGGIVHLSISTPLKKYKDGYKIND